MDDQSRLNLAAVRETLAREGRPFWRSLEELAEESDLEAYLEREAPRYASLWQDGIDRRSFLKLVGASLALAGLVGCTPRQPRERIVPYVREPDEVTPGEPLFFATAMALGDTALGLLVESREGRPIKVEGNPNHPASLGSTDVFAQAAILEMYDPERSRHIIRAGKSSTWEVFSQDLRSVLDRLADNDGTGLRVLTERVTSPTLTGQLERLLDTFPAARWHQYDPVHSDNVLEGTRLAFGEPLDTVYRVAEADVILSLDADFLGCRPGTVRYARDFADRRRVRSGQTEMNRLYVIESTPSNTGATADYRFPLRAGEIEPLVRSLASALGLDAAAPAEDPAEQVPWFDGLVRDLQANRGRSLVIAGEGQPPAVQALIHMINSELGNTGNTLFYTPPVIANPVNQQASLRALVEEMEAGEVELLLILGGNPVYTAPADIPFARFLPRVRESIHLSLYQDETSALCSWHLPQQHFLESWSDTRTFDGTVSIVQPLIAPLYDVRRSPHDLLAFLLGEEERSGYEIVRAHWTDQIGEAGFEDRWERALHDGLIEGTAFTPRSPSITAGPVDLDGATAAPRIEGELEIIFRPDPSVWDGRFANNSWLQELPKPLTKLTWDNAALLSPSTAERLGLSNEDLVELRYRDRTVRAPVWVMPGHADDAVTVHLGYGRQGTGSVGADVGFDAYALRPSDAPWFGRGLSIVSTGGQYTLATTQQHHRMEGRNLVRTATREQFQEQSAEAPAAEAPAAEATAEATATPLPSFYPEYEYPGYAWGMAIDLSACTGCNACVIACQAENNIPTVGKEEVERSREMHWIRVDRYYAGDLDNPDTYFQPVLCMHCEKAPCEWVCPVRATPHSDEGLNEMIYNRCVGTRYCSNNCPYKVRRFNFFDYVDRNIPILEEMRNPDVTVRTRGVMEKCTYCVQRINRARITAKMENRRIEDDEVIPACAQACPTRAIVFGDINDPDSNVSQLKAQPHNYGLLAELNTQPRTTYLTRIHNPNPELERE